MTAETIGPTGRNRLRYAVPGERHRARAAQHDGRNRLAVRPRKAPPCRSFRAEHGRATHLTTETVRSTGTERLRCAVSAKRHWSPKRHVSVRGTVGRPAATGSLCVLESGRGPERLAITHKPSAVRPTDSVVPFLESRGSQELAQNGARRDRCLAGPEVHAAPCGTPLRGPAWLLRDCDLSPFHPARPEAWLSRAALRKPSLLNGDVHPIAEHSSTHGKIHRNGAALWAVRGYWDVNLVETHGTRG